MLVQVTNLDLEQLASAPTPVERPSPEPTTEARAAEPAPPAPEPESQQPGWLRELLEDAPAPARSERRADADTSASPARRLGDRAAAESPPPRRDTPPRRVAVPDAPATPPPAEPVEAAPDVRSTVAVLAFEDITRDARDADFGADLAQSVDSTPGRHRRHWCRAVSERGQAGRRRRCAATGRPGSRHRQGRRPARWWRRQRRQD